MTVIKCVWKFWWDDDVIGMGSGGVVDAVVGDGEPEVGGGAQELGRQPGGGGGACLQGGQHGGRLQVGHFLAFQQKYAPVVFCVKERAGNADTFLHNNKKLGSRFC